MPNWPSPAATRSTKKTREDLQEILQAARRSAQLTSQLLAFSRRQAAMPQSVEVDAAITSMLRMLRRTIGEHAHLIWKPNAPGAAVWIDPVQLDQVVLNLVVNARDAIESGKGEITLETGCRTLTPEDAADSGARHLSGRAVVEISVTDTGCGIQPDLVGRLFEPFFTTKDLGRGTGMGLATVHGIVHQNQGFIRVHSEPQKGSTFRIFLPKTSTLPKEEKNSEIPAAGGSETVMFVEDEEAILRIGKNILERHGYRVLAFSCPREALSFLETEKTDIQLLITDVIMPEINGRELCDRAHALRPGLKVLFMSGYPANVITSEGILKPGTRYLQKPFHVQNLLRAVREAIDEPAGEPDAPPA